MTSLPQYYITPEEYLALERKADYKSEYVDGVMYEMAGGSERHNLIVANLIISIGINLRGRPCRVYPGDLNIRVPDSTRFFYPDISVVCGEIKFAEDEKDIIFNPVLIAEAFSESTAGFDRGTKSLSYQQIDSLQEYFLVGQDDVRVEKYTRQSDGSWIYMTVVDIEGTITLPAINIEIQLRDIYDKVS